VAVRFVRWNTVLVECVWYLDFAWHRYCYHCFIYKQWQNKLCTRSQADSTDGCRDP